MYIYICIYIYTYTQTDRDTVQCEPQNNMLVTSVPIYVHTESCTVCFVLCIANVMYCAR